MIVTSTSPTADGRPWTGITKRCRVVDCEGWHLAIWLDFYPGITKRCRVVDCDGAGFGCVRRFLAGITKRCRVVDCDVVYQGLPFQVQTASLSGAGWLIVIWR